MLISIVFNGFRRALAPAAAAALLAFCACAASAKPEPTPPGAILLDTSDSSKPGMPDKGIFSILADGGTLWVGRQGGVRKYDAATGQWKFYPAAECKGRQVKAMALSGGKLWALIGQDDGWPCVLDTATGKWSRPDDWKIDMHVRGGREIYSTGGRLVLDGRGGPDWEGISVIDPAAAQWLKLFKTKPVSAFWSDGASAWAGVTEGIVHIDFNTNGYKYFLASAHGCGASVNSVVSTPSGVFFGTRPGSAYELGLTMAVYRDGFAALSKRPGQSYSYRWTYYRRSDRKRLTGDVTTAALEPREVKTPGGLCLWDGGWKRLSKKTGLSGDNVSALAFDGKVLYAGTDGGLDIIDPATKRTLRTVPETKLPKALAPAPGGVWVMMKSKIYRIPAGGGLPAAKPQAANASAPQGGKPAKK